MSTISGAITNINAESKMSKAGKPFKVYSIEVNGQWFEAGFKAPGGVGDFVTFDYSLSYGKNKITDGTLSKGSTGGARPYAAAASGPAASAPKNTGKSFPIPKDHPDRSIIRQNAVTRAIEVMSMAGALEAVDLSSESARDVVAGQVISLATRFEAYYSGDLETIAEAKREGECTV